MNKLSIKIFKLAILLGIAVTFTGCNTLFQNDTPYYKISALTKDYCNFEKGTQWVYQNDSTNAVDTIEIDNVNSYVAYHTVDATSSTSFRYDVIEMNYKTNGLNFVKGTIYAGADTNDLYRIFFSDTTFLLALAPGFPTGDPQLLGGQEGVYTNKDVIPDMTLNGLHFTDILHSQEKVALDGGDTTRYELYLAPQYGLVKWTKTYQGNTVSYSLKAATIKKPVGN